MLLAVLIASCERKCDSKHCDMQFVLLNLMSLGLIWELLSTCFMLLAFVE